MNKMYYMILAMLCFCLNSNAQALTQAEYFWDTDPGEGNGTSLPTNDGGFNGNIENLFGTNIAVPATVGLHTFNVRVKDSNNQWGPANKQVIEVSPAVLGANAVTTAVQAEYFWDADPGEGNATAFAAQDANFNHVIEDLLQTNISVPVSTGLHIFNVRIKDSNNQWGPVNKQVVNLSNALLGANAVPTVAEVEYFWDTDPGEGSGLAFPSADTGFDSTVEKFVKSDIAIVNPVGLHVFNVRARDNTGAWGPLNKQVVYIETTLSVNPAVMADSYYFSPNPGTTVIRFNKDIAKVDIIDWSGRLVKTAVSNKEINIADLAIGTYVLKVTSPEGITFNKKMIKR